MSVDSDIAAVGEALDERSKERRAHNRTASADILIKVGVAFSSNNDGVHLIVHRDKWIVDFWPGTGLWRFHEALPRNKRKFLCSGRGIFPLLQRAGVPKP